MGKRSLLFVAYRNEELGAGSSYVVDLAKTMGEDIALLLVRKKNDFMKKFERLMTAISFAEAGDHETARQVMIIDDPSPKDREKLGPFMEQCRSAGVDLHLHAADVSAIPGIGAFLRDHRSVDKIVLSPSLIEEGNMSNRELTRLVRSASRPVVTMTRLDRRAA